MIVTRIQSDILEYTGRFFYLTTSQLVRLTGVSLSYLRAQLTALRHKKLIASYHVAVTGKVRAENVWYLLPLAQEVLAHECFADDLHITASNPVLVVRDYFHRVSFIDTHIALWEHCKKHGLTVEKFLAYYHKKGSNRKGDERLEALTKLSLGEGWYIPDGILIAEHEGERRMFIIEHYQDKYTNRIIQSIAQNAKGISHAVAHKHFGIAANPIILCVFAQGILEAVKKRLAANEGFMRISTLFFFATLADVKTDFGNAFKTINGEKLAFFSPEKLTQHHEHEHE